MQPERNAYKFFKVLLNFFGNRKSLNYKSIVEEMLKNFRMLCSQMSVKVYLYSHLDNFPANLSNMSDAKGQRFYLVC